MYSTTMNTQDYLAKLTKKTKTKIFTRDQALAEEIWNWAGKRIPFGQLMSVITRKGNQKVSEIWSGVKQDKVDDPISIFLWRLTND